MAENIDFNKLTQKELLIMTHHTVKQITEKLDAVKTKQENQEVRLSIVEYSNKTWGGIFGAIAGAVSSIVVSIFK